MNLREYYLIPAKILLKLESADLTFTTLVGGKVSGKGTKVYHHKDPGVELLRALTHGRIHELDDDDEDNEDEDEDEDEHEIESQLGRLLLGN